jgi:hypothetical protein
MQDVPKRTLSCVPSNADWMVAKAVYDRIPDRPEMTDQETLRKRNPNGDNNKVAATEVIELEILCLLD